MNALERLEPARPEQIQALQQMSTHVFGGPLELADITGLYTADGETNLNAGQALEVINTLRKLAETEDLAATRADPEAYRLRFVRWITKEGLQVDHKPQRRNNVARKTDDDIAKYGARVFGLNGKRPCDHCGGSGKVDSEPDEKDIRRIILDRDNLAGTWQSKVASLLANPDLDTLRRIAERADTDLDGAAKVCGELSKLYEAAS